MKLIYPLFPLLGNSPRWVADVVHHADANGNVVYDARAPFRSQAESLLRLLQEHDLSPRRQQRLRWILGPADGTFLGSPLTEEHLRLFDMDHFGGSVVARDLYVLARADIVIVDANEPGYGEHMVVATYARLLGCRVWVVNDRILVPPFLGDLANLTVQASRVTDLLAAKKRAAGPEVPEARPALTEQEMSAMLDAKVDPFDDGTG